MIKLSSVKKSYKNLEVLKSVDLEINQGEVVSIQGTSGAGKSTLLHIMGTLDTADSGSVVYNGNDLTTFSSKQLARVRNTEMGFIFQFHHLLPEFTALENVCLPAMIGGQSLKSVSNEGFVLLKKLGIGERADHRPNQLSGGEQQRVAVARALINKPKVVFADEPSGNLDAKNALELHELFMQLSEDLNQAFVIVTHNSELAQMSHKQYLIKEGIMHQL